MSHDLTKGPVLSTMLWFSLPMILGNLLQQGYHFVDALLVGKILGSDALAAVGTSYALMTFLTSVLIGLCMGGGTVCSIRFGQHNLSGFRHSMAASLLLGGSMTVVLTILSLALQGPLLSLLQIPVELQAATGDYLSIVLAGLGFTYCYNYAAFLFRAIGNARTPLYFLGVGAVLNIVLDLFFLQVVPMGIQGAALATILAQAVTGIGLCLYAWKTESLFRLTRQDFLLPHGTFREIMSFSLITCMQQSVMNFGILMIQGLVNSFGALTMAAFAAAVKIDSLAYLPAQEFSNAFSLFVAQNHGAGQRNRIKQGFRAALLVSVGFCVLISLLVFFAAEPLMQLFIDPSETGIIAIGIHYLRVEGSFYAGIGILFLLYGYFRAVERPVISLFLTLISLGARVLLAYLLAPQIGVVGIWCAIPIGWILADLFGCWHYRKLHPSTQARRISS